MPDSQSAVWRIRKRVLSFARRPLWMGILNITPDSFSDGGRFLDPSHAVDQALALVAQGADLLDIGGESTRPGAVPVTLVDELQRVIPVIERVAAAVNVPISVDTYKAEVARQALLAGAQIVNDVSGLLHDADMPRVCANLQAGVVCMHMQGTPQTMQQAPHYHNVVTEIAAYFAQRLIELEQAGIPRDAVVFDPGVGFGKTAEHNLQILSHVAAFQAVGRPVLIGHSRKRFLKQLVGREVDERLPGTIGVSIAAAQQGAEIVRVHDVAANRDALLAFQAVTTGQVP